MADAPSPAGPARRIVIACGVLVALSTLLIADMDRPDADLGQWAFLFALALLASMPYLVLARATRTGPAWIPLLAAVSMAALDLGARVRVRWFPQDAQDGLLLVVLPFWLLPAALLLWCALTLVRGLREQRRRRDRR